MKREERRREEQREEREAGTRREKKEGGQEDDEGGGGGDGDEPTRKKNAPPKEARRLGDTEWCPRGSKQSPSCSPKCQNPAAPVLPAWPLQAERPEGPLAACSVRLPPSQPLHPRCARAPRVSPAPLSLQLPLTCFPGGGPEEPEAEQQHGRGGPGAEPGPEPTRAVRTEPRV